MVGRESGVGGVVVGVRVVGGAEVVKVVVMGGVIVEVRVVGGHGGGRGGDWTRIEVVVYTPVHLLHETTTWEGSRGWGLHESLRGTA